MVPNPERWQFNMPMMSDVIPFNKLFRSSPKELATGRIDHFRDGISNDSLSAIQLNLRLHQ